MRYYKIKHAAVTDYIETEEELRPTENNKDFEIIKFIRRPSWREVFITFPDKKYSIFREDKIEEISKAKFNAIELVQVL